MSEVTTLPTKPQPLHRQSVHLVLSITPDGAARMFLPPYSAAGNQTVFRVAPAWDLSKDALLPTELPHYFISSQEVFYGWACFILGSTARYPFLMAFTSDIEEKIL